MATESEQRAGKIIIVNGASSSGKSITAWCLQHLLTEPHLFAGIDSFTPMLRPTGHLAMPWEERTNDNAGGPDAPVRWVFPEESGDPVALEFGESGHRLVRGMHRALAGLALAGNDVIFEHVLLYEAWLADLLEALQGLDVYLVGIRCPVEVIESRERERGNRVVGQGRSHYEVVHKAMVYDIEVDTSQLSPKEAADRIADRILRGRPRAFAELAARRRQQK